MNKNEGSVFHRFNCSSKKLAFNGSCRSGCAGVPRADSIESWPSVQLRVVPRETSVCNKSRGRLLEINCRNLWAA